MAKTEQPDGAVTFTATGAIAQSLFVGFDGDVCGAGAKAMGVSKFAYASGEKGVADCQGIRIVKSGAALTAGNPVQSNSLGKAIAATSVTVTIPADSTPVTSDGAQPTLAVAGGVLPQVINGYVLDDASGADEDVRVKLI